MDQMRIQAFGTTSTGFETIEHALGAIRDILYNVGPGAIGEEAQQRLSTGSFTVDLAMRAAGIPAGSHVLVTGTAERAPFALLRATMATTANFGSRIAVVDLSGTAEDLVGSYGAPPERTLAVRANRIEDGLAAALMLLESDLFGLILIAHPELALTRASGTDSVLVDQWRPPFELLYDARFEHPAPVLYLVAGVLPMPGPQVIGKSVDRLLEKVTSIRIALNRFRHPGAYLGSVWLSETAILRLRVGTEPISWKPVLDIRDDGLLSVASDLCSAGEALNRVTRRGSHYSIDGITVGRGRYSVIQALWQNAELKKRLFEEVSSAVDAHRSASADLPGPAGAGPGEDPLGRAIEVETGGFSSPFARSADEAIRNHRLVEAWFEGSDAIPPLHKDMKYEFCVEIGSGRQNQASASVEFADPDFGTRDGLDLVVSIFSEDFEIFQRDHHLYLPKRGHAGPVRTTVIPRRLGRASIRVVISLKIELEILQTLNIAATVAGPETPPSLPRCDA
jgi:hypothetical protein